MSEKEEKETGNTDIAFKSGKLQIKYTYAFRVLTVILLIVTNVELFILGQRFVSKTEFKDVDIKIDMLKSSITGVQRDIAIMGSRTVDTEQDRRLNDLEQRLRSIERKP